MTRLRFETAQAVFETFPTAAEDIVARPRGEAPLDFLRALARGPTPDDAIAFCAYMLPRRETVWWSSQSVRSLTSAGEAGEEALRIAEEWVSKVDEATRVRAMEIGAAGDPHKPGTWVARAAGWSGGSLNPADPRGPAAPQHLTATAARIALMVALGGKPDRLARINACVERGVKIAEM